MQFFITHSRERRVHHHDQTDRNGNRCGAYAQSIEERHDTGNQPAQGHAGRHRSENPSGEITVEKSETWILTHGSPPMCSSWFLSARLSIVAKGRLKNSEIRRSRRTNALRNARSISCGEPLTAAGSGTPQWAVIGCPGHSGQTSLAALSQTVNTKSIFGAPGSANSSQLLLRSPTVGMRATCSWVIASGLTFPEG